MCTKQFDPAQHKALSDREASIVKNITAFTEQYFQNPKFDASHDFNHVIRVVRNAVYILEQEQRANPEMEISAFVVILGALLHDVEDRKYIDVSASNKVPVAKQELMRLGMAEAEAQRVQTLIEGVSYSSEVKNPEYVRVLIRDIPELAVVQDADRLDAIGAIGIARCFTFGGAKRARTLESSVEHFSDKLLNLGGMMKTRTGVEMAAERTERLKDFIQCWTEETSI